MDPITLAAIIGGGSSLAGAGMNFMGAGASADQQATDNRWFLAQRQAEFAKNVEMQYDFAKNGLSWRLADAAKNGISPLAALGATGPSFSPVGGSISPGSSDAGAPMRAIGEGLSSAGQNVSRALLASRSPEERALNTLAIARSKKENDLLDVQYRQALVNLARSANPGIDVGFTQVLNRDGTVSTVPTHGGQAFGPLMWSYHNQIVPAFREPGDSRRLDIDINRPGMPAVRR